MDDIGYLGYFHRGAYVIAIHADWPTYPGPGPMHTLYDMGQLPHGTEFSLIDDIDQCCLFVASGRPSQVDEWSEEAFHVAAWHSDLADLANDWLIDGIVTASDMEERRAKLERDRADARHQIEASGGVIQEDPSGEEYVALDGARYPLSDYYYYSGIRPDDLLEEFEASDRKPDILFPDYSRTISMTSGGWARLEEQLRRESALSNFDRLKRISDLGLYDTAIRDAGVLLETMLRRATGSKQYGLRLVDIYVRMLARERRLNTASIRRLRADLRSAFKFVRNEFAHQFIEVPQDRALALLSRLASLIELVETNPLGTETINSLWSDRSNCGDCSVVAPLLNESGIIYDNTW